MNPAQPQTAPTPDQQAGAQTQTQQPTTQPQAPVQPPTMQPAAQQPMATVACVYCATTLSYPQNSLYIQCPKCQNTMNPAAPHASYINCCGCNTLLSHPPTSLTIQCPKCLMVMDLPARGAAGMLQMPLGGDTSASRKSRKKRKDPNAPKRATNAYMIFCRDRRAALKEERPDLPFGKLGAKLGEMWRLMSPEEKKPYELRATTDRDRYKAEMGSYQSANMLKGNAMNQLGLSGEDQYGAHASKKLKGEDGSGLALDYSQLDPAQLDALMQQQQYLTQLQTSQTMSMQIMQQQAAAAAAAAQMQAVNAANAAGGAATGAAPADQTQFQQQPAQQAADANAAKKDDDDDEEEDGEDEE